MRGGGAAAESVNNFPAFFDSASGGIGSNISRQASPQAMQQHQANGVGAAGAGNINMLNGLPQAGHQMDINILYNLVLQLSEELSNNRNHVSSLIDAVQRLQVRAAQEGTSPTLASASAELSNSQSAASVSRLTADLSHANRTIAGLEESNNAYSNLVLEYENAFAMITEKIRPYAHSYTDHTLALHRHYNAIIAQERQEKMDMKLEQQNWQAGLGRVAEYVRLALREEGEGRQKWVRRVARLKQENRVLRKLAGVEEGWESSDDEMEGEGIEAKIEAEAGRSSVPPSS